MKRKTFKKRSKRNRVKEEQVDQQAGGLKVVGYIER